ncbi:8828_t:CDS:1, partial [Paraglomus brasilianum]
EKKVTREALKEIRRELREKSEGDKLEEFGEEAAKAVLESYIVPKK